MKTYVIVRLQIDGIHNWKDAKTTFPEVAYLSDPHRHVFHIEAKKQVFHGDRDVEFLMLKKDISVYLQNKYYDSTLRLCNFHGRSCEMIATEILEEFGCTSVAVFEDNENGGLVEI